MFESLLEGRRPSLDRQQAIRLATRVEEYLRPDLALVGESECECPEQFGVVFRASRDVRIGIQPTHTLSARPTSAELEKLSDETGIVPRIYTSFDLLRRPFWVANDLLQSSKR